MTQPVVKLEQVFKIYNPGENEVRAVDGVDLTIEPAEFLSIVGPSGSGKSSLLNCIGCLDTPTKGSVWLKGEDATQMGSGALSRLRNKHIGFIFQSFNLIPVMTARENVEFALQIHGGMTGAQMKKKVAEMLELLGLTEHADRRPSQLSGGQQQRVAIGRALVKDPALVLADEPTANLDRKTSEDIIALMRKMREELGATFIFSTHDELLMSHAKRVVRLVDGKIASDEVKGE